MRRPDWSSSSPWGSLSFRLVAVFVALLIGAAAAVGYLFDRGRAEALAQRDRAQLRLQGELVAGAVDLQLKQLVGDVQLLAHVCPLREIRGGPGEDGQGGPGDGGLVDLAERLGHALLGFGEARPNYLEIRLLEARDGLRELVGVERDGQGLAVVPSRGLGEAVAGLDLRAASQAPLGAVSLQWPEAGIDGEGTQRPSRLILTATAPIRHTDGDLAGLVLVRVDLTPTIETARSIVAARDPLSIVDERGEPLFASASLPRLGLDGAALPGDLDLLSASGAQSGTQGDAFIQVQGRGGAHLAYVTALPWDPGNTDSRLVFYLTQSDAKPQWGLGALRRHSLLTGVGLLVLASVAVGVLIRRQTRSLSALAGAAEAVARGDFQMSLPVADSSEVGSLVRAFRHMAAEVKRREGELAALNLDLERRVEERASELAREHALQRLILDSVADGVVVAGLDGHFVLWNSKVEQIVGTGPEAIPSERWPQHFGVYRDEGGEPIPMEELPLVRAIRGEPTDNMEIYFRHPRRSEGRWAQVTARPLKDGDGGVSGAVAVLVDVTERRRMEAHLQAHRAELGRFGRLVLGAEIASTTAHQLSQPLGALCNYAGAALRLHQQGRLRESELGEMLERIERLSARAGAILDRLRARIRRSDTPPRPFDVDAVVTSCLDFLGDRIQREGVRLERRPGAGLPPVLGDPLQLEHALIQLVANALEAMEKMDRGQRRLTLATNHDPKAGVVTIEVADTGPGVSAALVDRLFLPWETDKPGSLGIGLTIVETIIEAFGGRIHMEPGASRGTRFFIELPVIVGGPA